MYKKITIIAVLLLISTSFTITYAQDKNPIDRLLEKHMESSNIPGISVGIIKDNELIYKKAKGRAKQDMKLKSSTPIFIGSLSKSLTALGVMQLVEKGLVSLDDPIQKYIPYFKVDNLNDDDITVLKLLNHRSGLINSNTLPDTPNDSSLKERVSQLSSKENKIDDMQEFHYFNDNYNILGLLIEEVSGRSYSSYMKENIFKPLKMNSTTADYQQIIDQDVIGYTNFFGFSINKDRDVVKYDIPSGYILSNLGDMVKYLSFLMEGNPNLLTKESIKRMRTTTDDSNYAMGWYVKNNEGQKVVEHSGSLPGFNSQLTIIPEINSGYIYIMNKNYMFNDINDNLFKVITNQNGFNHFPYILVLRIAAAILLILTLKDFWDINKLIKADKNKKEWIKESVKSLLLGLFFLLGIIFILQNLLNLDISFQTIYMYTPDLAILWFIAIVVQFIRLIISLWKLLFKRYKTI
ncbi:MAG: serine hydrolase domain-containing protein [Bacillota bacterium]